MSESTSRKNPKLDRVQSSEFQNFSKALRTIMTVRKEDVDLGPIRPRKGKRTSPKTHND